MTWTRDKPPPHKHNKPDCPTCLAYRLACIAEDVLKAPYSLNFGAAAKALKPHIGLGSTEIVGRWLSFLHAGMKDVFFAQNRTIPFFCSRINSTWTPAQGTGTAKRKRLEYD